ncbi:MAG: preprotein translocase subunit YajC [Candidatus Omnitrophica bacterium]|nr:preprotein translocase subunit YajC [Candidatus Omnitrophota bacterium]MDD5652966.1 preprotein translocase subunit YajC [Candidatus Omnitrophota bacterium]
MPTTQVNPLINLFPLIIIFVVFYFLLIRPQKAREKEHQKMLSAVAKNDAIVTTGGIHGTVVNVKDKTLILRVDDNVKIEIEKNCVAYVKKSQGSEQGA